MAVQKSRKTRSRRGMRRSHDAITGAAVNTDKDSGEVHLRHHISPEGMYRGRQVIVQAEENFDEFDMDDEDEE